MVYLIDANIIIRFLVGDNEKHLKIATEIFTKVENGEIEIEILDSVLMETLFVLIKFYKLPKPEVIKDIKKLIALRGVVGDKILLIETLNIIDNKNIDFVDALICAKSRLQGYGKLSLEKDGKKKCEKEVMAFYCLSNLACSETTPYTLSCVGCDALIATIFYKSNRSR